MAAVTSLTLARDNMGCLDQCVRSKLDSWALFLNSVALSRSEAKRFELSVFHLPGNTCNMYAASLCIVSAFILHDTRYEHTFV